jgi:uncharacterized protein YndB with AHSA1/START domain
MSNANELTVQERGVVAIRIFDAPRDLVWRAFTDADHLKKWWGPNGFTNTIHAFDLKPGGVWLLTMHGPDGKNYENESVFVAVDWLSRIVFDHVSPPHFRATLTFEELGAKTKFTFRQEFDTPETFERVKGYSTPGLEQNLDRLGAHLPQIDPLRRELTITRSFKAPRDLVWQAWTDPKHLAKWWGPEGFTNPVCEVDFRVGGTLKIVMRAPDGTDYPMRGVFKEIVPPEKLVFTNFPVDDQDRQLIDGWTTVTFIERVGETHMTLHTSAVGLVPHASQMIAGMGVGWNQSLDRLAALVESAASR